MQSRVMSEWTDGASYEDKCDVLYQLVDFAMTGQKIGSDPSELFINGDNSIEVVLSSDGNNLAWLAPEVINGSLTSVGPYQKLYTIGLLAYWLYTGQDYYAHSDIDAMSLPSDMTHIIGSADVDFIDFGDALVHWTSIDATARTVGNDLFCRYLASSIPSTVDISYVCNDTVVYKETRNVTTILIVKEGDTVKSEGGKWQVSKRMRIPARPGIRAYSVPVTEVKGEPVRRSVCIPKAYYTGQSEDFNSLIEIIDLCGGSDMKRERIQMPYSNCVLAIMEEQADGTKVKTNTIIISRPQDCSGSEYILSLEFDSVKHRLNARIEDVRGKILAYHDFDLGLTE